MFNRLRKQHRGIAHCHRGESTMGVVVVGGLLALATVPALFFNEGRAVKTARALTEGAAAVVSVDASQSDDLNEEKLIHLSGEATTQETLTDERFGVSANAIRLIRTAEMYQWQEIEQKVTREIDGKSKTETEYAYEKGWDSELHASSKFRNATGHQNPAALRFESKVIEAQEVLVGRYRLPRELVAKLTEEESLDVDLTNVPDAVSKNLRADGGTETSATGFYWSTKPESKPQPESGPELAEFELEPETSQSSQSSETQETQGQESQEPQVGDVRVRFSVVRPTVVSVIAQRTGNSLRPFKTRNGREICMIQPGNISAQEMFDDAQAQNTMLTWVIRVAASIGLMVGIGLIFRPLTSITERIPIVGKVVGMGAALVAILLGGAVALLTISSAWLFYRPLIAVPMIVVGIAMLVLLTKLAKKRSDEAAPEMVH